MYDNVENAEYGQTVWLGWRGYRRTARGDWIAIQSGEPERFTTNELRKMGADL